MSYRRHAEVEEEQTADSNPQAAVVIAPRHDPRKRLLEAMIETVALRGYDRTTISRVLSSAGLEEAVFSEHFHDKHDCFWQAVEEPIRRGERVALELFELDAPWGELVRAGLERLLRALADDPDAARVLFVEMLGAGPAACERQRVALALFISLIERGRPGSPNADQLPTQTSEAIVGGIASILHRRALEERLDELPSLVPDLTYFALLPYLDHERALEIANATSMEWRGGTGWFRR
ncbi:MAG: TetR/AcrR family transcriptional regulator [Solirubrobacteraceae bacterium]